MPHNRHGFPVGRPLTAKDGPEACAPDPRDFVPSGTKTNLVLFGRALPRSEAFLPHLNRIADWAVYDSGIERIAEADAGEVFNRYCNKKLADHADYLKKCLIENGVIKRNTDREKTAVIVGIVHDALSKTVGPALAGAIQDTLDDIKAFR